MKHFYRYLPLSDETRTQSLYVIAGGYTHIAPETPYPPAKHPADHHFRWQKGRTLQEYQLIYITRGEGEFESKSSGKHHIRAGSLFMLFPGEWHRYSPSTDTGWDEYWVAFQGTTASETIEQYPWSPSDPVLYTDINDTLMEEFVRISEEMRDESIGYQKIIAARTLLILALAAARSQRRNFEGTEILHVIERAKCVLLEQMDQTVNVEELSQNLGVGYSWFRRMFREYTGLSPAQYHLQLRINHAGELLRTTTLPIAAISQKTGFESAYYFSRIFKEKMGHSPRDYRIMSQRASSQL